MSRIRVTQQISRPREVVWAALADLGSHAEWMRDARSIEFVTEQRRGVGTRMEVETVVGPFRTLDVMEVTAWREGESIDVRHQGLVTGTGTLGVIGNSTQSEVYWDEDLSFPWWLGGAVTAFLARPILASIWRANLAALADAL